MNQWHSFLNSQGAQWRDDQLTQFSDSDATAALQHCQIPLLNHQLIVIEGVDAQSFLQGQTTCDMTKLNEGRLLLGAHCNAQGRMSSSFWAFKTGEQGIALRLPKSNITNAVSALKKYLVFAKATLTISPWVGFLRTPASAQLASQLPSAKQHSDAVELQHADGSLEYWGTTAALTEHWCSAGQHTAAAPGAFDLWQIRRGLPEVTAQTSGEFIPQQFNFHLLDGISFKKGCYTGQEIIARINYRGQVKKVTLRASLADDIALPAPGTPLRDQQKEVGIIVNAAKFGGNHEVLMCASPTIRETNGLLNLHNTATHFSWLELPYGIPSE